MKICNKCKKKLANNDKICKYCGSDVSKCKIIYNNYNNSKKHYNNKKKVNNEKRQLADIKEEKKVVTKNNKIEEVKNITKKEIKNNKIDETKKITKNEIKNNKIEEDKIVKKELKDSKISEVVKENRDVTKENKKEEIDKVVIDDKQEDKNKEEKTIEKSLDKNNKKKKVNLFDKIKQIKKNHDKKEKSLEKKAITKKDVKKLKTRKLVKLILSLFIILLIIFLIIFGIRKIFHISEVNVVKEGTYNNIFSMNEKIKYKGVIYSVTDAYSSQGTEYRNPKDGNEYVVVTIDFENDSKEKTRYSYQDWKMVNSLGEEKSRTFTPVNVSTALYTGNLVIGGKKSGSLVFEEPIGDEKLYLNFYEYKEDEEIDENAKPVFKIKIEVPKSDI